jgi:hypothetical protein
LEVYVMADKALLKYLGKKSPFSFSNPALESRKATWNKKGDVIEMPLVDAQWFIKNHPTDFKIVLPEPERPPIEPEDQDEREVLTGDGVDGVGGTVEPEVPAKRLPGRPPKNAIKET